VQTSSNQRSGARGKPIPPRAPLYPQIADDLTFEGVYHDYFRHVVSWIRAMGVPDAEIEDVAQEVFLVVRRRLPSFHNDNLPGWLYRIAQFKVHNFRRMSWFKNLFSRRKDLDPSEGSSIVSTPAMALEQKQDQRVLADMLAHMSDKRRETLILFEIEGFTGQEIARLQGVPVKTVWTRLFHARKDLVAMVAAQRKQTEAGMP
jgi:RNA polymerase sigma-70 factor (ECF subfamily)